MSDTTKRDIAKDRAMCEAATGGPWVARCDDEFWGLGVTGPRGSEFVYIRDKGRFPEVHREYDPELSADAGEPVGSCIGLLYQGGEEDAHFIAESRTALPHYIDRTEIAECERDHLKRMVEVAIQELSSGHLRPTPGFADYKEAFSQPRIIREQAWRDYLTTKAKAGAQL